MQMEDDDLLTKRHYEEWLSVTDIRNMAGIFAIHQNISKNVKNVNQYLADTVIGRNTIHLEILYFV